MRYLANLGFSLFNLTIGKILRGIQKSLINRSPNIGLHYLVNQNSVQDSAEYAITNFSEAMIFRNREALWDFCIARVPQIQFNGIIAEFGVWKGESINYLAKHCPDSRVFGFDSFEGLEEDWYGFRELKGAYGVGGELPKCEKNVKLFKGWFEETVPHFIVELGEEKIQILHMDADTYKPTAFVLDSLSNNIGKGTIIMFDEFFGYPSFRLHEFKAWHEFASSRGLEYRWIGYTEIQTALEIV